MPDAFWMMVSVVAPVVVLQISAQVTNYLNNKKANASREEIKSTVAGMKDQIDTVKMHKDQVDLLVKGAERKGFEGGIEVGKQQNTGPAPLGDK